MTSFSALMQPAASAATTSVSWTDPFTDPSSLTNPADYFAGLDYSSEGGPTFPASDSDPTHWVIAGGVLTPNIAAPPLPLIVALTQEIKSGSASIRAQATGDTIFELTLVPVIGGPNSAGGSTFPGCVELALGTGSIVSGVPGGAGFNGVCEVVAFDGVSDPTAVGVYNLGAGEWITVDATIDNVAKTISVTVTGDSSGVVYSTTVDLAATADLQAAFWPSTPTWAPDQGYVPWLSTINVGAGSLAFDDFSVQGASGSYQLPSLSVTGPETDLGSTTIDISSLVTVGENTCLPAFSSPIGKSGWVNQFYWLNDPGGGPISVDWESSFPGGWGFTRMSVTEHRAWSVSDYAGSSSGPAWDLSVGSFTYENELSYVHSDVETDFTFDEVDALDGCGRTPTIRIPSTGAIPNISSGNPGTSYDVTSDLLREVSTVNFDPIFPATGIGVSFDAIYCDGVTLDAWTIDVHAWGELTSVVPGLIVVDGVGGGGSGGSGGGSGAFTPTKPPWPYHDPTLDASQGPSAVQRIA